MKYTVVHLDPAQRILDAIQQAAPEMWGAMEAQE